MSANTPIGWTDNSWPCIAGCRELSPGCANCYAARLTATRLSKTPKYRGLAIIGQNKHPRFTGEVRIWTQHMDWPLRWRAPKRIFVADMSDLFYEEVSDETIAAVFGVMAACPQHTFQVLTKRADRMSKWFGWMDRFAKSVNLRGTTEAAACLAFAQRICEHRGLRRDTTAIMSRPWPLTNVHAGVSVEDQKHGLPRVDVLRTIPAALRFLSIEPQLQDIGEIDLRGIGWCIVGGESGPGARPFDLAWARSVVRQCRAASVPVFLKQLGAKPFDSAKQFTVDVASMVALTGNRLRLRSRKGVDEMEWPEDLRGLRQFPAERT